MIGAYTNQSAVWRSKTAVSDTNEATYAPDATIKCRVDYARKMVRSKTGQEVVSEISLFTTSPVKPDDIIVYGGINWFALTVKEEAGLSGNVEFYEVSL